MPRRKKRDETTEETNNVVPDEIVENIDESEPENESKKYTGLIMVRRSPQFRQYRGNPLELDDEDEVVAVSPDDKRVVQMLSNGNAQFVSNKVRGEPRIITPTT